MSILQEVITFAAIEKLLHFKPRAIAKLLKKFSKAMVAWEDLKSSGACRTEYGVSFEDLDKCFLLAEETILKLEGTTKFLIRGSELYPKQLELITNCPYVLYARGNATALSMNGVSVVGSRQASPEGQHRAARAAKLLGAENYSIVSGLALGIDTAAHIGALQFGHHTTAVIGTPISSYYPKENRYLQDKIAERGVVVSQFSPLTTVQRLNFPLRNEVMSGLSLATVIVEAGETSGALTQAKYALSQGRKLYIMKNQLEKENLAWPKKFLGLGAKSLETMEDLVSDLRSMELKEEQNVKPTKQLSLI